MSVYTLNVPLVALAALMYNLLGTHLDNTTLLSQIRQFWSPVSNIIATSPY